MRKSQGREGEKQGARPWSIGKMTKYGKAHVEEEQVHPPFPKL